MDLHGDEWGRKGATLSDKTARAEYGLTQDEIFAAIDAGTLQYRPAAMHGNPWLRLLRHEVEDLAMTLHGERYLRERQAGTELARINRELKQLRAQLAVLEERRAALVSELGEQGLSRACAAAPPDARRLAAWLVSMQLDGPGWPAPARQGAEPPIGRNRTVPGFVYAFFAWEGGFRDVGQVSQFG